MTQKVGFIFITIILLGINLYQFSNNNYFEQSNENENCPTNVSDINKLQLKCLAVWFNDDPEFPDYPLSIIFRTTWGNLSGAIDLNDEGRYRIFKEGVVMNYPMADNYTFLVPDLQLKFDFTNEINI